MSKLSKILLSTLGAVAGIGLLHAWLNLGFNPIQLLEGKASAEETRRFRVGFLPVTCHLTCPVTDWINHNMAGEGFYEPVRFSAFPEIKESLLAGHLPATFMLAPMAMVLRQQGAPIKIVYLGHRDGTALMVHKDSDIRDVGDLKGKKVAIPSRFSNQHMLILKALKQRGMTMSDITLLEMPPPDMPAALSVRAVDAISSGEPFMAQSEMDGYGRVLYQAKEIWPGFISCVLVVSQKTIDEHPEWVQQLVTGIAKSGLWLEGGMDHRMKAANAVATNYYNQDPRLLSFVLSKPPDRVTYSNLALARKDFEEIAALALEAGILDKPIAFEEYADTRFSENTSGVGAYSWEAP
ncbi:MAG TPA: ABC transporter substrate-binding protein [Thermoanaerobaculia bacterium]|nr:ABC transporter substrate-binding protein [Thermoanaerobaculia bacterium]